MKFKLGFAAGFAAGYWLGTIPADQRKAKFDELWSNVRENPRVQRVSETVTTDARRLGDAVEQRFVDTTDSAIDKVAGTVEPGTGETGGSSATSGGANTGTAAARRSA